jgi:hypothetical protein
MTDPGSPTPEERTHLAAMESAKSVGFKFALIGDVIHGNRQTDAIVDTVTAKSFDQAYASRYRDEDYPNGTVLWQTTGSVAEVIAAILELPDHGELGVPSRSFRSSSGL